MGRRKLTLIDYSNRAIAESFRTGPSTYLIRGSAEWDNREMIRLQNGAQCVSFGSIQSSAETNGRSARYPYTLLGTEVIN